MAPVSQKMGKKSRVKTQKSGTGAAASVSPKETLNLTSELLQKCSSPAPGPGKEWEEYVQIRSLVEKIRKKQKGLSVTFDGKREDYFPDLMKWASENGASVEGFEMVNFKEEGFGLRATRDIKAEELFLWVPRKLLMTVESAKNSVLGPLYSQDRILQAMGNITLAFHLLCERADPNSFWQPYIQTLPSEYDTPLYFEEDEVRYLQSTQAIHDVFSQYKNTARQYAYFYKVIQVSRCWQRGGGGELSAECCPEEFCFLREEAWRACFCFYRMSRKCGWNTSDCLGAHCENKQRLLPSHESHDVVLETEDNLGMLEVAQVCLIQEDAPSLNLPRK